MAKITQTTRSVKGSEVNRTWHLIDMADQVLGRQTQQIATYLQGKHKVNYVPNLDMGDNVVVINAQKLVVTGRKMMDKVYTAFSGYPGGLTETTLKEMMAKKPEEVVRHAVSGMLPKNKLRDRRMARLHIYADDNHPYKNKFSSEK